MWLVATSAVNGNLPFRLDPGEYIVGRSPMSHIVLDDSAVSRRHAKLVCEDESVIVEDLRSRHGTFVNDEPAAAATAQVGARLRFGSVLCLLAPVAMYPAPTPVRDGLTPCSARGAALGPPGPGRADHCREAGQERAHNPYACEGPFQAVRRSQPRGTAGQAVRGKKIAATTLIRVSTWDQVGLSLGRPSGCGAVSRRQSDPPLSIT